MTPTILQGDARDLPTDPETVALIVTSPPYNVGLDYGGDVSDLLSWRDYEILVRECVAHWSTRLIPGGRLFVNVQAAVPFSPVRQDRRRYNLGHVWDAALSEFFEYRDTIAWVQDSYDAACAWGSWLRPSAPNLRGGHELIYVYSKGGWARSCPPQWKGWQTEREGLGGNWEELVRNVWTLKPVGRKVGPAPFPVELPARAIRLSTYPDDLVVDPFCGRGASALAAAALRRPFLGVDLSAREVEEARRIVAEATEAAA